MVIPVVFLLLVVVSPTAAITLDTDGAFNARVVEVGGIGGGGDGGLGLGFIAAPLIGLAVLAAIAGSRTGATVVPGTTTILRQVPTPRVSPVRPAIPVFPTPVTPCTPMPACPANYQRIGIPAAAAGAVLQSCYRVHPATATPINSIGAAQMCAAENAVPVEFDTAGESEAIAALIQGLPGMFFTGHTDAFNPAPNTNVIVGISSGMAAVSGTAFTPGVGGVIDCGVIASGANPTGMPCATPIAAGVVCEISLLYRGGQFYLVAEETGCTRCKPPTCADVGSHSFRVVRRTDCTAIYKSY